jgi:N-dimethylarginine dimethylaminohydrolase
VRRAPVRRFLMCPPTHFEVTYSINPWMEPDKPTDAALAVMQWERLRDQLRQLGHRVHVVPPLPGLPDMVFAANAATVVDGRVLATRFRHPQRFDETPAYLAWFRAAGYPVREGRFVNEGEGDFLVTGERILAGTGFRTDRRSHAEAATYLGRPVVTLTLVDPYFYHLDTALAVLDREEIMYYPGAFSRESRAVLRRLYPAAIQATRADAEAFGLNAISDGRHVLLPQQATGLADTLRRAGFTPIGVDLSELLKAGGGPKCCVLELRDHIPNPTIAEKTAAADAG